MESIFSDSTSFVTIDLSSFVHIQDKLENCNSIFKNCTALTTIYVSSGFSLVDTEYCDNLFYNDTNLVGGAGTKYTVMSHPGRHTYAHEDGGDSSPGYFILKS